MLLGLKFGRQKKSNQSTSPVEASSKRPAPAFPSLAHSLTQHPFCPLRTRDAPTGRLSPIQTNTMAKKGAQRQLAANTRRLRQLTGVYAVALVSDEEGGGRD